MTSSTPRRGKAAGRAASRRRAKVGGKAAGHAASRRRAKVRGWGAGLALLLALALLSGCAGLPGLTGASAEQRAAYQAAESLAASDPDQARLRFEDFVREWPDSPLAPQVRLRLGELALQRGDSQSALRHFDYVVRNYPDSDTVDLARLRAGQIYVERGEMASAERMLQRLRLSRLERPQQQEAYRALVDAAPDDVTRLRRLGTLRAFESEEKGRTRIDAEIDRVLLGLEPDDLERAAEQIGERVPAARVRLRQAEFALERGDLPAARAQLDRAEKLPIAPAYATRLEDDLALLSLRESGAAPEGEALPTFSELRLTPPPSTAAARGELGVVLPLSGSFADFGEASLRGMLLAARVFEPDAPTEVRLLIRDSAGRPDRAAEAVRELAQRDQVSAIVGPIAAPECEAAAEAAEQEKVPLLTLTSRPEIAAPRSEVLRLRTMPSEEVDALVEYAMRGLGARTFAILYPSDAYGRGLRDLFWDAVEERGGSVVGVSRYDPDATDFAEPIRRLVGYVLLSPEQKRGLAERQAMLRKARRLPQDQALALREQARAMVAENGEPLPPIVDFDALFIPESHEKVVLIAPQLAFHEVVGERLLGPSGWYAPDLVEIGRQHVEGAVFTAPFYPKSELPSVEDFEARYLETYGEEPEPFAAQGYDAASLALMQLAQGRRSRAAMRRGLLSVHGFPGVTGVLSMNADGNARKRPFLLSVEHGEIIQVE